MLASIPPACSEAVSVSTQATPHTLSTDVLLAPWQEVGLQFSGCVFPPSSPLTLLLLLRGANDLIKLSNSYLYHVVN